MVSIVYFKLYGSRRFAVGVSPITSITTTTIVITRIVYPPPPPPHPYDDDGYDENAGCCCGGEISSNGYNTNHHSRHFQILLRCPLSLTPLKWPALSISCKHLQCFDLLSFLSFTRNNLRFLCPICSIQVCWDELLICPFTLEILSHYPDAKALNIYSDGSFQIVREEIEQDCTTTSATTPRNKNTSNHHPCHVEQPQIIDLSDDDDDE